jgi:hypothetical protein
VRGARAAARARHADRLIMGFCAGRARAALARHAGRGGTGRGNTRGASRRRAAARNRKGEHHSNFIIVCWHLGRWGAGAAARADRLPRAPRRRCRKQHNKSHKNTSKQRRQAAGAPRLRRHPRPPVLQRRARAGHGVRRRRLARRSGVRVSCPCRGGGGSSARFHARAPRQRRPGCAGCRSSGLIARCARLRRCSCCGCVDAAASSFGGALRQPRLAAGVAAVAGGGGAAHQAPQDLLRASRARPDMLAAPHSASHPEIC